MAIEDFVRGGEDDVVSWHPLLRWVDGRSKAGETAAVDLYQPPEMLGYRKAKIYIHLFREWQEIDCKSEDWDDDLNAGLVRLGVKSASVDGEQDRFALGLRAAFRKPERRFGDGYFNSVLVEFVQTSDFRDHPDVAAVLKHIPHIRPNMGGSYEDCRDMIQNAIRSCGVELTRHLNYSDAEAVHILSGALARYLDERFSVSRRRLLGLL